jgi:hypothetical protein
MLTDQSADIDAHDLVYRPAHSPRGGRYGDRIDIAYLNAGAGRTIYEDDKANLRANIDGATWWVFKARGHRHQGQYRHAVKPRKPINVNAITGALFDLAQTDCGPITVYGADLYAGGPGNAYHAEYDRRPPSGQARGIILHEPWKQMRIHRAVYRTGKVVGDDRYLAAVTMTDEEYQAAIDRWAAALQEAPE